MSPCSHLTIVTMQACSRASYSNDSYFGAPVGGNDYSTGRCMQFIGYEFQMITVFKLQLQIVGIMEGNCKVHL